MNARHSFAFFTFLVLTYVVVASTNYDRVRLLAPKQGQKTSQDYSLWRETTQGRISRYDPETGLQVNLGKGLFVAGPDMLLQRGSYRLTFHLRALHVDPDNPWLHYDVIRISRSGRTEFLARGDLDARNLVPAPSVTFWTDGGPGHQFLLYVQGADTKVGLESLELDARDLVYWPYFLRLTVLLVLLILGVWILGRLFGRQERLGSSVPSAGAAGWVALGCFTVYVVAIFQPFWSLAPSFTGDAPNFVVLADYMATHHTIRLPGVSQVYDPTRYVSLVGFRIPDPHNHLHEVAGHVYPHHQYGYPILLALVLSISHSLVALQLLSAGLMALGVFYLARILSRTPNARHAPVLAAVMGLSPPLLFYSHAMFTETLAMPLLGAAFYYLVLTRPARWVSYLVVALVGLLLFVKFKYAAAALPLLAVGIYRERRTGHRIGLAVLASALLLLYELHVWRATGSFFPFAWYRRGGGSPVHLSYRLKVVVPMLLGYVLDQRFGLLLVVPYTWLVAVRLGERWRLLRSRDLALWTAVTAAGLYLGLTATTGFGGACPALRHQTTVWPLLAYVVFSVKVPTRRWWVRGLLLASVAFAVLMLLTGYYTTGYTESYSKFYEAILPYRFQLWRHLPNLIHVFFRITVH